MILVAAFVVASINLHFHCILLGFAEKLAALVMTFMCSKRSICLSNHIGVIVTWTWCTSLWNRIACFTPRSRNCSQGASKARISLLVLTDSRMFTFHRERTFSLLFSDWLHVWIFFNLFAIRVENTQLLLFGLHINSEVDKSVLSYICRRNTSLRWGRGWPCFRRQMLMADCVVLS